MNNEIIFSRQPDLGYRHAGNMHDVDVKRSSKSIDAVGMPTSVSMAEAIWFAIFSFNAKIARLNLRFFVF